MKQKMTFAERAMSGIIEHFSSLPDPRTREHKKEHKLIDILFIAIAAVIWGRKIGMI